MKITAQDLKELSVVDKVIPEYGGADDDALTSIAAWMKGNMKEFLRAQNDKSGKQLAQERYDRFRSSNCSIEENHKMKFLGTGSALRKSCKQ